MVTAEAPIPTGTPAPDFDAETADGARVRLADLRGREAVLLMFYPEDDTPGCTRQMCAARDAGADYRAAGVARFGVNPGGAESHAAFVARHALDFPLIVDEGTAIARAYGAFREGDREVRRATVLIDRDGSVVFSAFGAHGADAVLGALRG